MIRYPHNRKKKSRSLAVFIVLLAVFLSFSAVRNLFGVRSLLLTVIYPFQYAGLVVYNGIAGIPSAIGGMRRDAEEKAEMKKDLLKLKSQVKALSGLQQENARLRSLLGFKQRNPYRFRLMAAEVIGKAPTPWYSILTINRGGGDKVKKGLPVITEDGLAGQIIEVAKYSSKVLLIIDGESSVAAASSRSRDYGVVAGSPSGRLFMKYVGAVGDVQPGDIIVTSKISSVFPQGIPIGEVVLASKREHDLFYHVEIKPAVDFSRVEKVFVVY